MQTTYQRNGYGVSRRYKLVRAEKESGRESRGNTMKINGFRPAFCVCVFFAAVLVIYYMSSVWVPMTTFGVPFKLRSTAETATASASTRQKQILLWTALFDDVNWMPQPKEYGCPVHNCQITSNKTLFSKSDAVIFHWRDVKLEEMLEISRLDGQIWVLFNEESPPHTPRNELIHMLQNKFNLFVSYREESDYYAPYGLVERAPPNGWKLDRKKLAKKQKMVAWMVSNCHAPSHRDTYVKELKEFIDVDVYGDCGEKVCLPKQSPECLEMIEREYKFYLSFENSICKDYVTEKLFGILKYDIIPVVLGGANYNALLPPNSYIDVLNFTSPKNLANFLHYVAGNADIYESFLTWKPNFVVKDPWWLHWVCDLCKDLNDDETRMAYSRSFHKASFVDWWYADSRCTNWEELILRVKS